MKPNSELRTLLFLEKSLKENASSGKTLLVLKLIMAVLIMVCVLVFMFATSGGVSPKIAIPLVGVCGVIVGHMSYYIHSIELWPHYKKQIDKASVEKRLNELRK